MTDVPSNTVNGECGPNAADASPSLILPWMILVVAGVVTYANSFDGAFLFDDIPLIVENQALVGGGSLWDLLSRRRPLVWLSLALNHAISGLDTWSYHAFNLSVHILAGLMLFALVRRTLNREDFRTRLGSARHWLALIVALIWLVHPIQTQVVTYVIQRAEALMALFFLCMLYCVLRGSQARRPYLWYALAIVACFLGMASKPTMIVAPFVVLLYDWVFISARVRKSAEAVGTCEAAIPPSQAGDLLRKRGWLYSGLFATWILPVSTGVVKGLVSSGGKAATVGLSVTNASPWEYALTQTVVILHYLRLAVWPHPLCLDYDWPIVRDLGSALGSTIVIAALIVGTCWLVIRRSWLGWAGAWFLIILAPTSSVIPIQDAAVEHRMHLPLAAVILVVVVAAWSCLRFVTRQLQMTRNGQIFVGVFLTLVATTGLGLMTIRRNRDYRSPVAMWMDVIVKRPNNPRGHYNLGKAYSEMGRINEAIERYEQAIALDPRYFLAYYGLGYDWGRLGRSDLSIRAYRRAVALQPDNAATRCNLANALAATGQADKAIRQYETALRIDPEYALAQYNLGTTFMELGRYTKAIDAFQEAVRLAPTDVKAWRNLGVSLQSVGRFEQAASAYQSALRIDPDHATTQVNLGRVLLALGRKSEAHAAFRKALEIDPNNAIARDALNGS